jgi:hypothetical protein
VPADPSIAFDAPTDSKRYASARGRAGRRCLGGFDALAERLRTGDPRRAQALAAAERLRREYAV